MKKRIYTLVALMIAIPSIAFAAPSVERLAGQNRYETALQTTKYAFDSADTAVIVSGAKATDALSASLLADALKAPLLLTEKDRLPEGILAEFERLGVTSVVLVGGESSVGLRVESVLEPYTVTRVSGANRTETALRVAEEIGKIRPIQMVGFFAGDGIDALAASSMMRKENGVLLPVVATKSIIPSTVDTYSMPKALKPWVSGAYKRIAIGGSATLAEQLIANNLKGTRIFGADRYATALMLADEKPNTVVVASGRNLADALAASNVAFKEEAPVLLLDEGTGRSEQAVLSVLKNATKVIVVGGAVPEAGLAKINSAGELEKLDTAIKGVKEGSVMLPIGSQREQKSLPQGSKIAVLDLDHDGWDELLVSIDDALWKDIRPTGEVGRLVWVMRWNGSGFDRIEIQGLYDPEYRYDAANGLLIQTDERYDHFFYRMLRLGGTKLHTTEEAVLGTDGVESKYYLNGEMLRGKPGYLFSEDGKYERERIERASESIKWEEVK